MPAWHTATMVSFGWRSSRVVGGTGADEESRPALATGRKRAERVVAGRGRIDAAISVPPLVHRHPVGVPGSKLVEFLRGLHRKPQRPRHIVGGLPCPG